MGINKYARLIFRAIFVLVALYHAMKYVEYTKVEAHTKPIDYSYIETNYHRGGRGDYYQIKVIYDKQEYMVNITRKISGELNLDKKPTLYFSKLTNSVFSEWDIKRALRITLVFIFLFIITFVPARIFEK